MGAAVQGRPGQPDQGIRHGTGSSCARQCGGAWAVERPFWGGTGREDIVSDRGWFDQLSDKYVSSIPLGRVASPPTSSGPSCFFPDRVPATSRAGPASERRQVDPLKVEDGYAAARASVFDRTTAGYLSRAVRCVRTRQRQDPVRSGLAIERAIRPGSRETFDLCRARPGAGDRAVFMADTGSRATSRSFASWREHGPKPASMSPWQGIACALTSPCAISLKHPGGAIGRRPRLAGHATEPAHHSCGPLGGRASGLNWRWHGRHATRHGNARRGRGHQRHIRSDATGADDAERAPAP